MNKILTLSLTLFALVLTGCKKNLTEALMPDASGSPYDLYVVMDDAMKETSLNDTLHAIFEYPMECTPNGDPYFRVRHLTPENFTSQVIRIVANVVLVDIDFSNASEPLITLERDRYAKGQIIVKMHAKNAEQLAEYLPQLAPQMRQLFVNNEINRHVRLLKEQHQLSQGDRLMRLQDLSMCIPTSMNTNCIGAKDSTFFWVTDNFASKQSYLVAYSIPYTDQNVFSLEGAVAIRDSVMGANIEGEGEGAHMETNQHIVLPEYKALNVGGKYVGELRGMWRMKNGLMAGPFVCHIKLDEINRRVVFVEGFVYAPNDAKRTMLRNLEAVLYTLKLPSDNLIPEIEVTL